MRISQRRKPTDRRTQKDMDSASGSSGRADYSQLGRELLAKLGVKASNGKHETINALWQGDNGATIYVGNQGAAKGPADVLLAKGITHVVNCTDDLPNFCAGSGKINYYKLYARARPHRTCPSTHY